jgi:hypothetical protein
MIADAPTGSEWIPYVFMWVCIVGAFVALAWLVWTDRH